jgi:predicted Zn-dependent protease
MCTCRQPACTRSASPTRRAFLAAAVGGGATLLAGCDQVASLVVAEETVERLGLESWAQIVSRTPPSRDRAAQQVAEATARRLLETAGLDPRDWEVRVFADPSVNAFALPGRKIGIFEGILPVARDEPGLAAIVGHEIGHLAAEHPAERITAQVATEGALQIATYLLAVNDVAFAREIGGLLGLGAEFGVIRPYGRRQELEADRIGVAMMADAGYDPRAAVGLWQRMAAVGRNGPPAFLSTHPAPDDRIEAIEALIADRIGSPG